MEAAIELIRWSGLILALLLTLVVLKEVAAVLRTLSDIRALAGRIRDAAVGMAENVRGADRLRGTEEPLARLRGAGADLASASRDVAARVENAADDADREAGA